MQKCVVFKSVFKKTTFFMVYFSYLSLIVEAIEWVFWFCAYPWNVADCYCTEHHVSALKLIFYSSTVLATLHMNKNYWWSYITILTSFNIWTVLREWRTRDMIWFDLAVEYDFSLKTRGHTGLEFLIHDKIVVLQVWHNFILTHK